MVITLVRHGQTEDNYLEKMQGSQNNLLNDTGRRQCQKLREEIREEHYDACYMSPLIRAVETAMILIGDRVEMIPDKRLVERELGSFEGRQRSTYDPKKYRDYEKNSTDGGVEGVQDVFKRCSDFSDYIFDKYDDDSSILVVSHGATIRAMHHLLLNHDLSCNLLDINVGNCYKEVISINTKI